MSPRAFEGVVVGAAESPYTRHPPEGTTTETLLVPLEEQVDYDDYRDVGGVQMPFRVRISDGAPYSTTTRTILEIRRNVPVEDALFRPPPTSH